MSTRATTESVTESVLIARKVGDGWKANYHHFDGYPAGLGAALFRLDSVVIDSVVLFRKDFDRDVDKMLKVLLDEHRGGWSSICGTSFENEPGFIEITGYDEASYADRRVRPQCYCHGDRSEGPYPFIKSTGDRFAGAEYCYVINPEDDTMAVLERRYSDGSRAVQFFGVDASEVADGVNWEQIGEVDLNGEEPDWASMQS